MNIYPDCDMRRWEVECSSYIEDASKYYTKKQVDDLIESATSSGNCCITEEEVDDKIESAKTEIEAEIPSLSGYATEQWVLDQNYITGVDLSNYATKGEIPHYSAGTGIDITDNVISCTVTSTTGCDCDFSDYYTKEQVDNQLKNIDSRKQDILTAGSGISIQNDVISCTVTGTCDLSNYYTTAETVNLVESAVTVVESEIPDMSNYYYKDEIDLIVSDMATKTWVLNQNYATYTQLVQYMTNLQNQIDALRTQISGCCADTGTTLTRWITMTGTSAYTCSGTTKMSKEQEEQSVDGGNTWTPTGNYRAGNTVLEPNCIECGYTPVNLKLHATYSTSEELDIECDGNILKQLEPQHGGSPYIGNMITAEVGGCAMMIDYTAFAPATNLRQVVIDEGVETIGQKSFSNCWNLSAVTIPNSVINIDSEAFYQCSGITNLTIGSGVTVVGSNAFSGCSGISNDLNLPNVTRLNTAAFAGCRNLHSVTIGSGCTRIEGSVFKNCSGMTSFTIYAETPPTMGSYVFEGTTCNIYVPQNSVDAYKAKYGWRSYASRIFAIQ